jgi:hypothetical protein
VTEQCAARLRQAPLAAGESAARSTCRCPGSDGTGGAESALAVCSGRAVAGRHRGRTKRQTAAAPDSRDAAG